MWGQTRARWKIHLPLSNISALLLKMDLIPSFSWPVKEPRLIQNTIGRIMPNIEFWSLLLLSLFFADFSAIAWFSTIDLSIINSSQILQRNQEYFNKVLLWKWDRYMCVYFWRADFVSAFTCWVQHLLVMTKNFLRKKDAQQVTCNLCVIIRKEDYWCMSLWGRQVFWFTAANFTTSNFGPSSHQYAF